MDEKQVKVLLVEDNPADVRLIQELLAEVPDAPFRLECVDRLSTALERVAAGDYGVVLLDLSLPDSEGLESLARLHERRPDVPIIVATGMEEEALALTAVQEGAHDFLVKSLLDSKTLVRALCYAVERNRLLTELEQARVREQHDRELAAMEQACRLFEALRGPTDSAPLRETHPELFASLVERYGQLLDAALLRRAYKVEHELSEPLEEMAEEAGAVRAGPCDIAQVHLDALREKRQGASPAKAQAYFEEGSRLILEFMGRLVAFYRK